MPLYIVLGSYTDQGIKTIGDAPARMRQFIETNEGQGFKLHGFFWTMGEYDIVIIIEAPNQKAMMQTVSAVGMQGNVRTRTLPAFTMDQLEELLDEIS